MLKGNEDLLFGALSFAISLALGAVLIPFLKKIKAGQPIRQEGPKAHRVKAGTPTMGGLIFLIGPTVSLVFLGHRFSKEPLLLLGLTFSYAFIGFLDDYKKVRRLESLGLRAREKLALEILFAAIFIWFFTKQDSYVILPFTRYVLKLGAFYPALGIFFTVGFGNAVNLADGLDGLAGGLLVISLSAYYFIVSSAPGVMGLFSLLPVLAAFLGGLLAFLIYNRHPSKIMMGDVGSLAMGGFLSGLAIITHTELVLLFMAAVPAAEALSVILQVASFQLFGKRVFKMSPVHHHFELSGWKETKVVYAFWACQILFCILGVLSMSFLR